jgi:iron(III) transport system substrate-binding protein
MPCRFPVGLALRALLLATSCVGAAHAADELVVYSERKEPLIQPIFARYQAESGVKVRYFNDQAPVLIERLAAEGEQTRADIFLAVDAGSLWQAAQRGVLAPVVSKTLEANVPAALRDPERRWFGLSQRARTIVYSTTRVKPAQLSTYAALAAPEWKGRLCLRSSKKVYNQSLVAMMLARNGEAETEATVRGWVANLAAAPLADDTLLVQAIAAGQCDVGIVNTYYLGRMLKDDPKLPVTVFWPDQQAGGVHVNVSGAGVVAHSRHKDAAIKLLEWLSADEAQHEFAAINLEFPVNPHIEADALIKSWGPFTADPINVAEAGRRQAEAVKLMDRAGYR